MNTIVDENANVQCNSKCKRKCDCRRNAKANVIPNLGAAYIDSYSYAFGHLFWDTIETIKVG